MSKRKYPLAPIGERIAKGAQIQLKPSDYDETKFGMTVCSMVFDGDGFIPSEYDCVFLDLRVENVDELGQAIATTIEGALRDWREQETTS